MTLSDLQARMSYDELQTWVAYVDENGPLNPALRLEGAVARAVAPFLKNTKAKDLMPWPRQQEVELPPKDMAAQLAAKFKGLASQTNSRKKH
jgi:hypothetical protein